MVHPCTSRERRVLQCNFAGLVFQQRNITPLDAFFFYFLSVIQQTVCLRHRNHSQYRSIQLWRWRRISRGQNAPLQLNKCPRLRWNRCGHFCLSCTPKDRGPPVQYEKNEIDDKYRRASSLEKLRTAKEKLTYYYSVSSSQKFPSLSSFSLKREI